MCGSLKSLTPALGVEMLVDNSEVFFLTKRPERGFMTAFSSIFIFTRMSVCVSPVHLRVYLFFSPSEAGKVNSLFLLVVSKQVVRGLGYWIGKQSCLAAL